MPELVLCLRHTPSLLHFLFTPHTVDHLILRHQGVGLAYVDPGAGLLAIQILGTSVMGAYYLLRRRLQSLFSRPKPEDTPLDTQRQAN